MFDIMAPGREDEREDAVAFGPNQYIMRELNHIHRAADDSARKLDDVNRKIDGILVHQLADLQLKVATLEAENAIRKSEKHITEDEFEPVKAGHVTRAEFDPIKKLFWAIISALVIGLITGAAGILHAVAH